MWPPGKQIDQVTEDDLTLLITEKVRENIALEYKRQMYQLDPPAKGGKAKGGGAGTTFTQKVEMLRDISSMANSEGGIIVIGMDEDGEGRAKRLVPVANAEKEATRIVSCCLTGITERIPGLRTRVVPVKHGDVILIDVPRSYRRPHMVSTDDRTDFWVRHDRRKSSMSVSEIRTAVTVTEEAAVKSERFIEQRRESLLMRTNALHLSITATPLLLEDFRVDTRSPALIDLLKDPPPIGPTAVSCPARTPRFDQRSMVSRQLHRALRRWKCIGTVIWNS